MNFQTPVLEVMEVVRKTLFPLSLSSCPRKPELSEAQHFRQRETRAAGSAFSRPSLAACAGESSRERAWITRRYLMSSFIIFEIFSHFSCSDHPDKMSKPTKCEQEGSPGEEAQAHPHGWPQPWRCRAQPLRLGVCKLHFLSLAVSNSGFCHFLNKDLKVATWIIGWHLSQVAFCKGKMMNFAIRQT